MSCNKKTATEHCAAMLQRSTDFPRRTVERQGRVHCRMCALTADTRLENLVGLLKARKQCNWCGGQSNWKASNSSVIQGTDREAKVFRARAAPRVGENLINAPKLPANQKKTGDSRVNMVVQNLPEKSRLKTMDGLRRFIMVDNHEAVKFGDL